MSLKTQVPTDSAGTERVPAPPLHTAARRRILSAAPARRPETTSVVLIDDEPLLREALARTLIANGLRVLGEARSSDEAVELVIARQPDVVLMDIRMPDRSGLRTIERIRTHAPDARVLVLTRPERNRVVDAIIAGASGYILKTSSTQAVLAAIRETARGECVLAPQVAGQLLEYLRQQHSSGPRADESTAHEIRSTLTQRELQIFGLVATGQSNQRIGHQLGLSAHTVANHIKSILLKLGLENRTEAAALAVRAGFC